MVLNAQMQVMALLTSAMAMGWIVAQDPTPNRLIAGAGYGFFCLAALFLIKRK
jgi:hypothetical protein